MCRNSFYAYTSSFRQIRIGGSRYLVCSVFIAHGVKTVRFVFKLAITARGIRDAAQHIVLHSRRIYRPVGLTVTVVKTDRILPFPITLDAQSGSKG